MTYKIKYRDGSIRELETLAGANLTGARLTDADLTDADLTDADLTGADLTRADLTRADLTCADLTDADLADVIGLPDAPSVEGLAAGIPLDDSLQMSAWHCGTAHCLAGWAVVRAGEAGAALEDRLGTPAAGALIWWASEGVIPDFYQTDRGARAWLAERKAGTHAD